MWGHPVDMHEVRRPDADRGQLIGIPPVGRAAEQQVEHRRGQSLAEPAEPAGFDDERIGEPIAGPGATAERWPPLLDRGTPPVAHAELRDRAEPECPTPSPAQHERGQERGDPATEEADERIGGGRDREGSIGESQHEPADRPTSRW